MTFLVALNNFELIDDGPYAPQVPGELEAVTPEQELLAAMLRQAMLDAESVIPTYSAPTDANRGRLRDEARAWLASPEDRPFSFVWTCHALRLDPDYVRAHQDVVMRTGQVKHVRRRGRVG